MFDLVKVASEIVLADLSDDRLRRFARPRRLAATSTTR